jgi:hypothetical protein
MVDATDLKSVPELSGYGFESHHRQRLKSFVGRQKAAMCLKCFPVGLRRFAFRLLAFLEPLQLFFGVSTVMP